MSIFYRGEKVVFKQESHNQHPLVIYPNDNEIVTLGEPLNSPKSKKPHWKVLEYPVGKDGRIQNIRESHFRKLSEVSDELSEEILNEVLTTIPELV